MTLNSLYFIFFLIIVYLIIAGVQLVGSLIKKDLIRVQIDILLISSYLFIALNSFFFCLIILITSIITYFAASLIMRNANRRIYLGVAITGLVLELVYFKYMNFLISSFGDLWGTADAALNILLPLGISFYIFTAIGYLIDVFRGEYDAEKNFVNVALTLAYFPKIIAGPIVRGNAFLPQLKKYRGVTWKDFQAGIQIFIFGLFKKIVLADHLNVFVNDVFRAPVAFNTGTVILAVVSYSLQIYFDFSGYSDMAIGISRILGIKITPNFNLPYVAKSPSEFWERWHISLSSWLRDYVYFPLGGNRKGNGRTYINLMLVMLISGLWHGVGWTFIFWGFLHGMYSCVYKFIDASLKRRPADTNACIFRSLSKLLNFFLITIFWIFFRANSFDNAFAVMRGCFTLHSGISQPYIWSFFAFIVLFLSSIYAAYKSEKSMDNKINGIYPIFNLHKLGPQIILFTFIGLTVIMGYYGNTAFIYGTF